MVDMGFTKTDLGFRAAYVMVPIKVDTITNIICNMVLAVESEGYNRSYQVKLPVYENEMKAGYAYLYNITLEKDTVLFTGVNITDWNVIDFDGSPIIPVQVD